MLAQFLSAACRSARAVWRSLADSARKLRTLREQYQAWAGMDVRETRGIKLLREWLSPEQRSQFDAERYFDVIGCISRKRYRIRYGTATNVHEIDDTGCPITGWCFVPDRYLVPGDVMLAQKIALETDELAALAVANQFPTDLPRTHATQFRWRAY
jgi:hypothetical protein